MQHNRHSDLLQFMRRLVFLTVFTATLMGCASGPQYQPIPPAPAGKAVVVIYRQPTLAGSAWATDFWIDGKLAAKLRVKGYTYIAVPPGVRQVSFASAQALPVNSITFTAKEGDRFFVAYGTSSGPVFFAGQTPIVSNSGLLRVTSVGATPPELTDYVFQAPTIAALD